jgi:hypothetical protein
MPIASLFATSPIFLSNFSHHSDMALHDLTISGDGRHGQNGMHGYGFIGHALAYGVKGIDINKTVPKVGTDGGHATVPTGGDDSHSVHVSLIRSDDVPEGSHPCGYILATVDKHRYPCTNPEPHSPETVSFSHDIDTDGNISLSACGGYGGNGGNGGTGEGGGRGMHGVDATRFTRGTDGQAGGNGGDAGHGTSGANGGRAGEITIMTKEKDMDLLMAMHPPQPLGGRGGIAGANGVPGLGGNGGNGGASYSWYS